MAINPNDFIFHSDYTVNGLLSSYKETLTTSAIQLAPGATFILYGTHHDIGSSRSVSVATWVVPNLPQTKPGFQIASLTPGSIKKGGAVVSTSEVGGHQPLGVWFFPFAYQSGSTVQAAIKMFNNSSVVLTVPVAEWKMKISTYIIPPNTI